MAMQKYMAYYHFVKHEEWAGFRNIDKKINFNELNKKFAEMEAKEMEDAAAAAAA
jgi:hypothetical protein